MSLEMLSFRIAPLAELAFAWQHGIWEPYATCSKLCRDVERRGQRIGEVDKSEAASLNQSR